MSSYDAGRCRRTIDAMDAGLCVTGMRCDHIIADAIDRLAADVAAIKAKVDDIAPEDVAHLLESEKAWVRLVEEKETAAIRERDEARAEVEKLHGLRDAEVERLKNELYDREQELLSLRADTVERCEPPAAPQPAAPLPGWLTDDERAVLDDLASRIERWVNTDKYEADRKRLAALRSILARAGSPPVVEVPAISRRDVPMQNEAFAYRDALDKAGVKWKEVGRE